MLLCRSAQAVGECCARGTLAWRLLRLASAAALRTSRSVRPGVGTMSGMSSCSRPRPPAAHKWRTASASTGSRRRIHRSSVRGTEDGSFTSIFTLGSPCPSSMPDGHESWSSGCSGPIRLRCDASTASHATFSSFTSTERDLKCGLPHRLQRCQARPCCPLERAWPMHSASSGGCVDLVCSCLAGNVPSVQSAGNCARIAKSLFKGRRKANLRSDALGGKHGICGVHGRRCTVVPSSNLATVCAYSIRRCAACASWAGPTMFWARSVGELPQADRLVRATIAG